MRRRLFLLVMLAVVPLAAVIAYNLAHLYTVLETHATRATEQDAAALSASVTRFVRRLTDEAATVGLAVSEANLPPDRANGYLADLSARTPGDAVLLDSSGRVLASSVAALRGQDFSSHPAVRRVIEGAGSALSDFGALPGNRRGFAVFVRVAPGDAAAPISGTLLQSADLQQVVPIRPLNSAVVITDRQATLAYTDEEAIAESAARLKSYPLVRQALGGAVSTARRTTPPGMTEIQIGSQRPVPPYGWTAGFYIPRARALSDVRRELLLTSAAFLLVLAFVLLLARRYGLSITIPLAELTTAADQVRQGRFDAPVAVHAPDEVGALAEDFRRMQTSLGHTFHDVATLTEASGRINSSLEVGPILETAFAYLQDVLDAPLAVATLVAESGRGFEVHAHGVGDEAARAASAAVGEIYSQRRLHGADHALVDLTQEPPPGLPALPGEPRYLVVLPLSVRSRHVGRIDAYCLPRESDEEFRRSAVPLAVSLSRQLAIALANARLFARQQLIADTLQDSLLSEPYRLAGVNVEVLYRAATIGARIGGDFFDFIPVGEHAMAIVVGDISGKGIDAARYTAIAKGAIRTLAYEDPWPASVLKRASRIIAEQTHPDTFVTAVYVLLDSQTGAIHYANAGHPSPLLVPPDGSAHTLLGNGPPLGVVPNWWGEEGEARLSAGDRLLLFTDGLTEARRDGDLFGSEGVARAAVEMSGRPLADLPGQLVRRAAQHADGKLTDDIAVVAVEKTDRGPNGGGAEPNGTEGRNR